MKIAICDDERNWINALKLLLDEYFFNRHIEYYLTAFTDGFELLERQNEFDIIFMDYQMSSLNGIEVSRKIREQNNNCTIIFVSSYPDIAIDAFEVDAYRFLVKPIDKEKLFQSLDAHRKRMERDDYLIIKFRTETVSIRTSEIIFCEATGKHSVIHTTNGEIDVLKNIKEIERKLSKDNFFRCHKAYIAAFVHIRTFNNERIVFDNGAEAFISRNYIAAFKTAFHEYVLKYNMEKLK